MAVPLGSSLRVPGVRNTIKMFSTTSAQLKKKSYQLVVVGGGSGGCAIASKFTRKLGKGRVAVIEPATMHYYQPMWTLVGGGMKTLEQSGKEMAKVLPGGADWLRDRVVRFHPNDNTVFTENGDEIQYEYLVVAVGLQLNYHLIKGLPEAFETPGVGSNYSPKYVNKTFQALKDFKEGNAVFTFPNTPIKCPGAPQKIMYIAEQYFRKEKKRNKANVMYCTSLPVIFGVKKYAAALMDIIKERNIHVNYRHNLIEVKPDSREAVFQNLDKPDERLTLKYEMLHVAPPTSPPDSLRQCKELVDEAGFLNVNKLTLQHSKYPNIFGIGDCTNVPTSKTAAGVAAQAGIMRQNLAKAMKGEKLPGAYDGYTSCPLVTGYNKCILAEFDFNGEPLETFPINQGKERRSMFHMKKDAMPFLYWNLLLRGYWEGPGIFRKVMHLGMSK